MPIRTWWAPEGIVSPLRLCTEHKYSNNMPQQLLLVSVIKLLPSLPLQKVQGSISRYSQMWLQKAKELFRRQCGSTKAMAEHPTSLRPESHRTAESWVRHWSRQLLWQRLFQNQLFAGKAKGPPSLTQDTMQQFSFEFADPPTLSWDLVVIWSLPMAKAMQTYLLPKQNLCRVSSLWPFSLNITVCNYWLCKYVT